MLLPAFPPLALAVGRAAGRNPWPVPSGSGHPAVFAFARGRFALHEGLRVLARERAVRRVWLPAYLCCPVVEAVEAAGLEPRFYDVDERLEPRDETIAPASGDALLVVHYFGLPAPLARLHALCRAQVMPLIEDCAHGVTDPNTDTSSAIGGIGDLAMWSLRKLAPLPSGGVLVVNDPALAHAVTAPAPRGIGDRRALVKLALMAAERVAVAIGWNLLALKDRLPVVDASDSVAGARARLSAYRRPPPPSRLVAAMLRAMPWSTLIRTRREGYRAVAERLAKVRGVHLPLPHLPAGAVPHALPVWVDAPEDVARRLRRCGVEAMRWPGREQVALDLALYPGAAEWLEHGVSLPLGVPLTGRRLDRLVAAVGDAIAARVEPPAAQRFTRARKPHASGSTVRSTARNPR